MNNLTRNTRGRLCLTGILLLGWAMLHNALAEKVYESVDAEGEVTFSDTPPPPDAGTTRQIELQSGPSAAQVQESRQQLQNLENRANEAGSTRQSQASQPVMGYTPASGESEDDESSVYVEGGYADERYRDERMREGAGVQREERRMPAGVSRPAARVR
jgi:hypothetical protein